MNKIFRLIGYILLFLFVGTIVLGFYSAARITVIQTGHLRAPSSLIWQYISAEQNINDWMDQIPVKTCIKDSGNIIICFSDKEQRNKITTVEKDEKNRILTLTLEDTFYNLAISEYILSVQLKTLRDGTTEVNCKLIYKLRNLTARVANKIYFEGKQKSFLEQNLEYLHNHFEKV